MSTESMLLISTDCCYHWDHHYFPLYQEQPQSERGAGSPISFSLFSLADCSQDTTAGLEYSVYRFIHGDRRAQWWGIKGANSFCQMKRVFPKLARSNFDPKRATITQKSWLQLILTHKLSNFYFILLVRSCGSLLNFPESSQS